MVITAPATTVTTVPPPTSSTAPVTGVGTSIDEYEVVHRETLADGQRLDVVIAEADYTDRNLERLVLRLADEIADLYELNVFDDAGAAEAFRLDPEELSEEQEVLLAQHYLVGIHQRNQVTFYGPFSAAGGFILGS